MITFFLTSIIAVCIIMIIRLLLENNKLKSNLFNNDDQLVDDYHTHSESINQFKSIKDNTIDNTKVNSELPSKNVFLYVSDNFGAMEKGVVLDGKTYSYDMEKGAGFEIQPAPKKKDE
jgi:hypothetical protein